MNKNNTQQTASHSNKISVNYQMFGVGFLFAGVLQPFEVLRTTRVLNGDLNYKQIFKKIYDLHGINGFFKGSVLSMAKSACSVGIFFSGIENIRNYEPSLNQLGIRSEISSLIGGCLAKAAGSILLNPIIVLKTRFEAIETGHNLKIIPGFQEIYSQHGLSGYFKGLSATLIRDVPYSGIQYMIYNTMQKLYKKIIKNDLQLMDNLALGGSSSCLAVLATHPFDNVRVRLQCIGYTNNSVLNMPESNLNKNITTLEAIKKVYKIEGIAGIYSGYLPRLLRKCAAGAITFAVFEKSVKAQIQQCQYASSPHKIFFRLAQDNYEKNMFNQMHDIFCRFVFNQLFTCMKHQIEYFVIFSFLKQEIYNQWEVMVYISQQQQKKQKDKINDIKYQSTIFNKNL